MGETDGQRRLFVSFTMRDNLVRVISSRPMHRKEREFYEEEKKDAPSENDVAAYWETHDAASDPDFSEKNRVGLVYQPPVKSISLRLPQPLILELKRISARMDVAYQSLIKIWLSEKIKEIRR